MTAAAAALDGPAILRSLFDRVLGSIGESDGAEAVSAAIDEIIDPDVVVYEPESLPWGGVHHGIDAFKAVLGHVALNQDLDSFDILDIVGREDYAVVYFRSTMRFSDGSTHENYLSEHYRLRNGKVVEVRVFYSDTAAIANAPFVSP